MKCKRCDAPLVSFLDRVGAVDGLGQCVKCSSEELGRVAEAQEAREETERRLKEVETVWQVHPESDGISACSPPTASPLRS